MNRKPDTLEEIMERVRQHTQSVISVQKQLLNTRLMPNMRDLLEGDLDNFEHSLQHSLRRLRNLLKTKKEGLMQEHYRLSSDQWDAALANDIHQVATIQAQLKAVNKTIKSISILIAIQEMAIHAKTLKVA